MLKKIQSSGFLLFLILLLATILRLYQLDTESLWIDEILSINYAENFEFKIPYLRPFYYFLLRIWMFLGESDAWLRGLSVIFNLGCIVATYELGRRLVSKTVGQIAAFLIAFSPLFINHAQEIRMYSLIPFLSVLGSLILYETLEQPTIKGFSGWVMSRIALLLSSSNTVLILFPDIVIGIWAFRKKRKHVFPFGLGLTIIGIFFLPPVYKLYFEKAATIFLNTQVADYSKPGLLQIVGMLTQIGVYWPLRYLLESNTGSIAKDELTDSSLFSKIFSTGALEILFYGAITVLLFGLVVLAFLKLLQPKNTEKSLQLKPEYFLKIIAWAMIPTLGTLAISYQTNSIWFPRYLLFVAPYILIIIATGFTVLWQERQRIAIAVGILYFIGVGGALKDYYTVLYRNDWQGAARLIEQYEQPGDVIIYYAPPIFAKNTLPRYYQGNSPITLLNLPREVECLSDYFQQQLAPLSPVQSRLWLVCASFCRDQEDLNLITETAIASEFNIEREEQFKSQEFTPIKVSLIVPHPKDSGKEIE